MKSAASPPTRERPCWRSARAGFYDKSAGKYRALVVSQRFLASQPTESSVILDKNGENYILREIRVTGNTNSFWIPGKPAVRERDREAMSASVVVNARTAAH